MNEALVAPNGALPNPAPVAFGGGMARLAEVVRGFAANLLGAIDSRIVKLVARENAGWQVEVEVFTPNPELTVGVPGASKAILERGRFRLELDRELNLNSLEPADA